MRKIVVTLTASKKLKDRFALTIEADGWTVGAAGELNVWRLDVPRASRVLFRTFAAGVWLDVLDKAMVTCEIVPDSPSEGEPAASEHMSASPPPPQHIPHGVPGHECRPGCPAC